MFSTRVPKMSPYGIAEVKNVLPPWAAKKPSRCIAARQSPQPEGTESAERGPLASVAPRISTGRPSLR